MPGAACVWSFCKVLAICRAFGRARFLPFTCSYACDAPGG